MSKISLYDFFHRNLTFSMQMGAQTKSMTATVTIPIRIPKIQRDYAEGRESEVIVRKRRSLLYDMLDVVYGVKPDLSFDFIYGNMVDNKGVYQLKSGNDYNNHPNGAFEPLDGQQRITTLFLMHWLFGRNNDIKDATGHSLFVYETRSTSEEFCNWLVKQNASMIVKEWKNKVSVIEKANSDAQSKWDTEKDANGLIDKVRNRLKYPLQHVPFLQDYMRDLDGFRWNWNDDPSIRSMITVLETALNIIKEQGRNYSNTVGGNLDKIKFLVLDDLMCDGDKLFEKMNARGKALSSFDILKSSLEEEMEAQGIPNSNLQLSNDWRTHIDGNWVDYWWDKTIGPLSGKPTNNDVQQVEQYLERMLLRMIGLSFLPSTINGSAPTVNMRDYKGDFEKSISAANDSIFEYYLEYARHERSLKNTKFTCLPFASVYNKINSLLYLDVGGKWHNATELLFQWNEKNSNTLFDEFLKDGNPTHNTQVMMYGLVKYLEIIPATQINGNQAEEANFRDWMRFVRNVYNGDNKNARLDNISDVKNAITAIDKWLIAYKTNYRSNASLTPHDCLRLIVNYIPSNPNGQEQARLDEEKIKAELRLNGNSTPNAMGWEQSILKAENLPYLWGQIIAPLSWSVINMQYDKNKFDSYVNRLDTIFNNQLDGTDTEMLLIQSMLSKSDYRLNCNNNLGSLGRFNAHRDHSWKRYLRDLDKTTGCYGLLFKELIDDWMQPATNSLAFDVFLTQYIAKQKSRIQNTDWRYYIVTISQPAILKSIFDKVGTANRYIYDEPNGHAYYFRSNTMRTAVRYELLTMYLYMETSLHCSGIQTKAITPTSADKGALAEFLNANNHTIRIKVGQAASYSIEFVDSNTQKSHAVHNLNMSQAYKGMQRLGIIK